ncbi:hypothetical protein A2926_01550 [Candidatus Giovannonibacteria bacterium RIFCSPLOWO2_01_FULL_44_40]|uniref:Transposase IS200-like domain-containing protein n=1 Tax=Candidatus Giovannonibacteria bacterium RIFCSPHIGHO2_01_FULL_45_23 TaxID=1798325 RepID=A0A1F5VFK7_9BACT|nr:MAG: hypothetical protein A2834_01740 [Candidatus Giovannonibacteria bacterium RIFCSPHIGHO2_01_FULL_45_23]OGF75128.1 MAG: hypothetical protein A3C77_01130 [Candidatus Giovannonibacteria bacterium RIFCSPHIGHO2_02_FULL_45_13]OGF79679.1 MAG: hypothetical protein A2926_01550 [Candidatus Giovannonibacteria bacterium RIFCSPLOWO2_01_FULL_44_40]
MASRKHSFVAGNLYHIYAHSIGDMALFRAEDAYKRFLNVLFAANGKAEMPRFDRSNDLNLVWDIRDGKIKLGKPLIKIVCFCLMPTHFHLILEELDDGNISRYMHRVMVSFSKYYNLKYERRGHVFESKFHSKLLDDNDYLLRAQSYVHLNPQNIKSWRGKEYKYPWSSLQDYSDNNRWGRLLQNDIILSQFKNKREYQKFVEETKPGIDFDLNQVWDI